MRRTHVRRRYSFGIHLSPRDSGFLPGGAHSSSLSRELIRFLEALIPPSPARELDPFLLAPFHLSPQGKKESSDSLHRGAQFIFALQGADSFLCSMIPPLPFEELISSLRQCFPFLMMGLLLFLLEEIKLEEPIHSSVLVEGTDSFMLEK